MIRFFFSMLTIGVLLAGCFPEKSRKDLPPASPAFFNCGDTAVKFAFNAETPAEPQASLETDGETFKLTRVVSGEGAKFSTTAGAQPSITFTYHKNQAIFERAGHTYPACRIITWPKETKPDHYRASGNEPFWHTQFTPREIVIRAIDAMPITFPRPKADIKDGGRIYDTTNGSDTIRVTITPTSTHAPCQDTMSGYYYPDHVTIVLNDKILKGCGTVDHAPSTETPQQD